MTVGKPFPYAVQFRGRWACPCLVRWLPVYEAELQRLGVLADGRTLTIYQLIGSAPASAGTHKGGAFDLLDLPGNVDVEIARQMGADATWSRPYNWDGRKGMPHNHGVLRGCPHNGSARYQIDAVDDGYNGLGRGGRGGRDTGPRPLSGRTWEQGIEWARARQGDEIDMATIKELRAVVREELIDLLAGADSPLAVEISDGKGGMKKANPRLVWDRTQADAEAARKQTAPAKTAKS